MKNRIFNKRVLSFLLTLLMIVGVFPAGAFAVSANEETQPVAESTAVAKVGNTEYATVDDAVSAAQAGDTITILAAVAGVEVAISKDITLDLGGKTITDAYIQIAANVTIKNGSIKNTNESYPLVVNSGALTVENVAIEASKSDRTIWLKNSGTVLNFNSGSILATKGENNIYSKIYGVWVSQGATANINGGTIEVDAGADATAVAIFGNYVNTVNITGGKISTSGKTYSYAVWTDGDVTVTGGEIVTNEKGYGYSSGITYGKNYAINTKGDVEITGGKITTNGPSGYLVNAGGSNQTVTISDVEFTNVLSEADKTAGGHSEPNLIYGSSVNATITGGEFEGVNKTLIKGTDSTLTVSGGTFDVDVSEYLAEDVKMEQNADGSYGVKTEPKGNNFTGYTSTDGIWGEVWGNATESFVIKVLDANDNVMGTTSLNNVGGIIDGDVNVSWNLKLDAASNTDEYWTMSWTTAPTINNMPAKVELWVDGVRVSGGPVVLHGPDEINKIVAASADAEGKITGYYTSLSAALKAVTDDNQTTVVLRDVTENLTASLRGNIVGDNVTITLTNSDWVYCPYTFVIGEGVTLKTPALFYYAGGSVIKGTLITDAYYQRYAGTKLYVEGTMTVTGETFILRYTDGDAEAGIYVNGGTLNASVIYFYQGMISATNGTINVGTYWQTNETDGQGSANLVLDNSTLNVTVSDHPAKATGKSTVTLTNGSEMNCQNGGFTYGENAWISVDSTSSIVGKGGEPAKLPVAKIGDKQYTSLEDAFAAAAEGDTITLLADVTPALTSQRAITKAAVIDLGGKTLTLTEDDLYFGTTTFKNGTIVVDPSVKPSTAVFWMFADQTLTFDGVEIVATGVTGTYLIGLDGNNSDLNIINGSEIVVNNETALDLDIICVNASTGNDILVENSKVNVTNLDGRVFFRGNYTISGNSDIDLSGITKAGFRIEAGQTLTITDTATVDIVGEPRDGGIHLTALTATYTKAETATVNATVIAPEFVATIGDVKYATLQDAIGAAQAGDKIVIIKDISDVIVNVDKDLIITGSVTLNNIGINANGADVLTVSDLTFTGNSWINSGTAEELNIYSVTANVTPNNASYTNSRSAFISLGCSEGQQLALTVEQCNIVSLGGSDPILGWAKITSANIISNTFGSAASHQNYSDSVKFMSVAEGAVLTFNDNTVYSDYNGIVIAQNTTRSNSYVANFNGNTFIGAADHIWIEISGASHYYGKINASSDNTVNGNAFTAADIKIHTGVIKTYEYYAGVDVVLDGEGKVIGGSFAAINGEAIAEGYKLESGVVKVDPTYGKVAMIGENYYATLAEAVAAAKAGDEIVLLADVAEDVTVPAGVIFNGNGKQVGVITAAGEITFKGHTKATNFGTNYTNTTINIIEGACLEITGTGRLVIGHGCTFNITGTITDAKTADKATIQPSLIVAAGASFTGTNLTFNVTNAYVKFNGNSTSKNSNANGTFNFNVTNSIWEQTGVLAFYVPTSGMDPTFNLTLKDSVLTTTSHLVFSVTKGEIVIDNSNVNVGTSRQIENRSTMTIKNGSVVNGAVATSSNAINPGTIIVENATYAVTGQFSGAAEGTGTLIIKKGATVSVGSIVDKANIVIDATGMTAADVVNFTGNLSKFAGTIEVVNNDKLKAKIVDGKIMLVGCVAKIGEKKFESLADALAAAKDGDTITLIWATGDAPIAMNGAVYGKSVTITGTATVDWSKGWLFIGRGGAGNGTVIFDNANLTSASNSSSYGFHVSGRENNTTDKYDGTLVINNSTIELDFLINKGTMTLDNSTLTVKNGFSVGGRPASETESGVDATATLNITKGSKVVVNNHNGMGLGYEAIGVMNIDATSSFETTQSFLVTAKGTMNVNGGTVKVAGKLTNNGEVKFTDVSLTGMTIEGAGTTRFYNTINFYGTNSITTNINGTPFELIVNKSATLLISRFVLGYNRNITVYGDIEDAHTFDPTGKTPSLKFNSTSGVSVGGTDIGKLTVEDAYIELGNSSWKNASGTYTWTFNNSYVSATSFTNSAAGSSESAKWDVTFDNSVLVAKNYIKNGVGTTYNFTNGSVATTGSLRIDGVMNIDETSSVTTTSQQNNKVGAVDEHGGINGTVNVAGTLTIGSNAKTQLEVLGGTLNVEGEGEVDLGENKLTLDATSEMTSAGNISGTITAADGAKIAISGGKYTQDVSKWCVNGYTCEKQADGTYGVRQLKHLIINVGSAVATTALDETIINAATMDEAVAAAKDAGADYVTYKISGAVELTTGGSHGILDLGKNVIIEGVTSDAKLTIVGGGVPDIKGVTFKNITLADAGTYLPTANEFMYQNYIDCSFDNVTFVDGIRLSGKSTLTYCTINANTTNEYAIWLDEGEFTMTGSTVTAGKDAYGMIKSDVVDKITISENTFKYSGNANKEALNTKGAIIVAENNMFIGCDKGIIPEDKTNYAADGTTVLTNAAIAGENKIAVAEVKGVYYTDIQEAIKAAAPAGTVELLADVTVDKWITISETLTIGDGSIITLAMNGLTINGNGHTITINEIESPEREDYLFHNATNLNIKNLTIKCVGSDAYDGGISLKSGTIENVTFEGGKYGVLPGEGNVTVENCIFNGTNSYAIYYEAARDNLVVTGNKFETADGAYAITMRGAEKFTNNNITVGRVNLANSAKSTVTGNDFGTERFKVYNGATANISENKINNLVFNDDTVARSTFTNNTLSDEAKAALSVVSAPLGDVNGDRKLTSKDVVLLRQYVAELPTAMPIIVSLADVTGDGKVTSKDVVKLRQIILEKS